MPYVGIVNAVGHTSRRGYWAATGRSDDADRDDVTSESVGAARKAFAVLSRLSTYRDGASLTELVTAVGYPPSTMHRVLRDLVEAGFAIQDPVTKLYWIGPEVTRIARRRPQDDLLRAIARPHLQQLADRTGETVFISVLGGFEVLSVDCVLSGRRLRMWGEPGSRGPLHATAQGKAMLSRMPETARARVIAALPLDRYTRNTITRKAELEADVVAAAERGFAINNEERDEGSVSIAAPIVHPAGRLIGAMSIGAPLQRWTLEEMIREFRQDLLETAAQIADRMSALAHSPGEGGTIELLADEPTARTPTAGSG
ncbi:hypothetical protein CFP66_33065 [Pseudonocardia sp. MH-G8]|nr:hypothetical protein CFP66_33065 [Pseudonocardia sp. MH-G8]